jgi:uncharacterized protein
MNITEALFDLFVRLRPILQLSIDQYDLLVAAVAKGHGHKWEELRCICQALWLKTPEKVMVKRFNTEFDEWQEDLEKLVANWLQQFTIETKEPEEPLEFQSGVYPLAPPARRFPSLSLETIPPEVVDVTQPDSAKEEAITFKGAKETSSIQELPIDFEAARNFCRSITPRIPLGHRQQIDLPRTKRLLQRQGGLYNLVFKPMRSRKLNLVVLVDDHRYLVPYRPVIKPLVEFLVSHNLPTYRFTGYPTDYLFYWQNPLESIHLSDLWSQVDRDRTIMIVVSDAGAASGIYSSDRAAGIWQFLQTAQTAVHQLYWLNPTPPEVWQQTTAITVNEMLGGNMIQIDRQILEGFQHKAKSLAPLLPNLGEGAGG